MKRFFAKAPKSSVNPNKPLSNQKSPVHSQTIIPVSAMAHTPVLQPKYVVPPVPHPCPHDHLAILATEDGLLIRPHIPGQVGERIVGFESHVRVSWGKSVKVEEVTSCGENYDWTDSAIIYGIVGILELYSSELFLLIYRLIRIGNFFKLRTSL
jgi:hypothetical protein